MTPRTDIRTQGIETGLRLLDRLVDGTLGRLTQGISPASLGLAYQDWAIHLAFYPGKQAELMLQAFRNHVCFMDYAVRRSLNPQASPCIEPEEQDQRFDAPQWREWPFDLIHQSFLLSQQWWHDATTGIEGVTPHHDEVVSFVGRQLLDIGSPSNFLLTNPEALQRTVEESGANLQRGWQHFIEDIYRYWTNRPPAGSEKFRVGENMAVTPGKVVYRNRLIELIQYEPTTEKVHPEPILIVPAWIMKYYILDLRPERSLVEYLVNQGHTVFIISWKNPGPEEGDLGMDDYQHLGVMTALDAVTTIILDQQVHAVGYCLGGTLLALTAATLARKEEERIKTITFFASQVDFSEPGELDLFIDHSQVTFLEHLMWQTGYLDSEQMTGAFTMLRSRDLIWSRMTHDYLLGESREMFDLMAWNADATHMPYRMHSDYLRRLFLNNEFADGDYQVDGRPIHFGDIRVPLFAVSTVRDHIAPWHSVYRINSLARTEVTFLLTSGGHNAGVVTPPGHPRRRYQVKTRQPLDEYLPPEQFQAAVPSKEGSWWPQWQQWLRDHSGPQGPLPPMGAPDKGYVPLYDAPGQYVLQK